MSVAPASRLRIERKMWDALGAAEIAAWTQLLHDSVQPPWAFLSPRYAEAVHAQVAPVDVLLCWQGAQLVGVMPLQRAAGWLGRAGLRGPAGWAMCDYFGLLARPEVVLNWPQLLGAGGIPCLYFSHLDESQAAHGLQGGDARVGLRTRIHPEGGAAHWQALRQQDKKLVSDTERRERKLIAEHGALDFQMHSATAAPDLQALVALKNAQYRRTGHEGGALLAPANVRLLQHLLAATDPWCQPRLSVLRCSGRLVAAHLGLQCGALLHIWFPVYDAEFSAYGPGRILLRHMLLNAAQYGVACFDRGEGDTPAKRDFANEEHRYFKGLVSVGAWGQAVSVLQRARWRWA